MNKILMELVKEREELIKQRKASDKRTEKLTKAILQSKDNSK